MSERKTPIVIRPEFTLVAGFVLMYQLYVRPQFKQWGTRPGEGRRQFPGDDIIINPNIEATRAIHIQAAPEGVWQWLAQMGRDGTGFYNMDSLSNNSIPSANYIRHDLAPLALGSELDNDLRVLDCSAGERLLIGGFEMPNTLGTTSDLTMAYVLDETTDLDGKRGTYLAVRMRGYSRGWRGMAYNLFWEPLAFAQSITQLYNLRNLAEASSQFQVSTS